jgi:hypothetical protein
MVCTGIGAEGNAFCAMVLLLGKQETAAKVLVGSPQSVCN